MKPTKKYDLEHVKRMYQLGWSLYFVSFIATLATFLFYPEDRTVLRIFLVAFLGPLIAQSAFFPDLLNRPWLKKFPVHKVFLGFSTMFLVYRGFTGTRQDLYIWFLLGMGPLFYSSNLYAMAQLKAKQGTPLENEP